MVWLQYGNVRDLGRLVREPERYVVYAMYDKAGVCLYVGRSALHGLRNRFAAHYKVNPWVKSYVDRIEILSEHFTRSGSASYTRLHTGVQ